MTHSGPPARRTGAWILVTILLLVAVLGTLIVPIYARSAPKLGSFPFFYWYQLLWVPVVALLTTICYLITTRVARPPADGRPFLAAHERQRGGVVSNVNWVSFGILIFLFALVTVVGFAAARWRRAEDVLHLNEWGLGGRGFGTFVTWFLLGGDLYTAYTFIAVPALVFGTGAAGFFTLSYTIMVYPIVFVFLPRLWSVARVHGYITPADFIHGRYGSRGLSLAVAFTGILAVMPYIALQLVGIQSVLTVMGVGGSSTSGFLHDLPLIIAFLILAGYTFVSGLRAPALIAFIKDTLIYVMIIVAIIYIPIRVGGWGHIFSVADTHLKATNPKTGKPNGSLILEPAGFWAYSTLALGSALALFMYPHNITGVFAANRRNVIRRNVAALPAYSLVLGLIALLGYMALAAPGVPAEVKAHGANAQLAVPFLFQSIFPSWFAGIGFSAIVIGALVPAAIMAIAAANLFARNIWKEYIRPNASDAEQTRVSQWASLVVKLGALLFVIFVNSTYAIQLQLLGGIWIVQTFPAIVAGLYTRWFHRWALIIGWAVAMVFGTIAAYRLPAPGKPGTHFGASTDTVPVINHTIYIGLTGLVINLVIATLLTLLFRAFKVPGGSDETRPHEYVADPEPATAEPVPVAAGAVDAG